MSEIFKHQETGEFCEHGNNSTTCRQCLESSDSLAETIEARGQEILDTMGLKWENLKNKSILEIGAGLAELAQTAKTRGIEVVSLEKNPEMWEEEGDIPDNVEYIVGDARELPFENESLDLVISKAAPPSISDSKKEVEQVISEVVRVLKKQGVFRRPYTKLCLI